MTHSGTNTPKRQSLALVMTELCNLSCVYCYEHKEDARIIPLETAKTAINNAFKTPGFDELEIAFFGGEPFAAFHRVKEICNWLWSEPREKPYVCFASTNGTLVQGAVKDWLHEHKKWFVASLSLDGTPEMHNKNRSNSYSSIDIDFFRDTWPFQPVKMTISPDTISNTAEGVIHIHKKDFKLTSNIAEGMTWKPEHFEAFSGEMKKLADFYLDNPEIQPVILDMRLDVVANSLDANKEMTRNYCGTGNNVSAVDITGTKYPCQTFMPMSSGGKKIDTAAMNALLASEHNKQDGKCSKCVILPVCQTCYGLNYKNFGSPFIRSNDNCQFQKIRAQATAYLWAGMLTHPERPYAFMNDRNEADRYYMIRGIENVYKHLQPI